MTLPSTWKIYAGALGLIVVASMIGLGYHQYTSMVAETQTLSADKAELTLALSTEKATVTSLKGAITTWQQSYDQLGAKFGELEKMAQQASAEARRLDKLFGTTDIEALARVRPDLVEHSINAMSDRMRCLLEHATAEDRRDTSECPAAPDFATPAASGAGADSAVQVPGGHAAAPPGR